MMRNSWYIVLFNTTNFDIRNLKKNIQTCISTYSDIIDSFSKGVAIENAFDMDLAYLNTNTATKMTMPKIDKEVILFILFRV